MSKVYTYNKDRICYIFDYYTNLDINMEELNKNDTIDIAEYPSSKSPYSEDLDEEHVLELLEGLPENHINFTYKSKSILTFALVYNHQKVVKYLLENYDDINVCKGNTSIISILDEAIYRNNSKNLEMLLNYPKIDVNLKNLTDHTALYNAVMMNNIDAVRLLLNHPDIDTSIKYTDWFDTDIQDNLTVLEVAKCKNYTEIIKLLEEHENKINL